MVSLANVTYSLDFDSACCHSIYRTTMMDCRQDKRQFVQQYVERQKAYLPTYTTEHPWNERHVNGTPSKPLRGGDFGFDTPVLRPRVPVKKTSQSKLTQRVGQSKSRITRVSGKWMRLLVGSSESSNS
ncbi:hypothetical protein L210DRAFT_1042158 [Boletus edulis BED1]|uniref:Uncharacterized protein n=1 Tax=Boletus edulis BED1 TaxID=1328754 RepID=A0AAD4G7W7_BOLED|nr:hypothetical protein L210DRAFT_1042158 [Boletus edulis BED1]